MKATVRYGVTFSHLHAQWLGLNVHEAFLSTLSLKPAIIRLCCYWKECEPESGVFDFSSLDELLVVCERKKQAVVLTIGMKAPRWPEFHLPSWTNFHDTSLHGLVLQFISAAVKHFQHYRCIQYWQVENEPIERMVTNFSSISFPFFEQEVYLVRQLDSRPIIGTVLANTRNVFCPDMKILRTCDVLGVDLYFQIPIFGVLTLPYLEFPGSLRRLIAKNRQRVWITELQAEPWESMHPITKKIRQAPMTASILHENTNRARAMGASTIVFWGVEYWISQVTKGDPTLFREARRIFSSRR